MIAENANSIKIQKNQIQNPFENLANCVENKENYNKIEEELEQQPVLDIKNKKQHKSEKYLIIQPNEVNFYIKTIIKKGGQTTYYKITKNGGTIGRHSNNQMIILEESVSRFHAKISYNTKNFYLIDTGSTTGTFIKVKDQLELQNGMTFEMGANQFLFENITILNEATAEVEISIVEGEQCGSLGVFKITSSAGIAIGRKGTNRLAWPQDQHLSNIHARIALINEALILEEMSSTNGTWMRLSKSGEQSQEFLLQHQTVFKIGTTSTYIVTTHNEFSELQQLPLQIDQQQEANASMILSGECIICCENERDALYLPCKHNTACLRCSKILTHCPICKVKIEDMIKIYKA